MAPHDLTNPRQWEPVDAPVTNPHGKRSPHVLRAVVAQFDVLHNPRYRRTSSATWCNIFSWDVTRALCAEIPHWIIDPTLPAGRRELTANGTLDWLELIGPDAGWREFDARDAAEAGKDGHPTVAIWRNPTGRSGHIAVLLPGHGDEIRIAQAGARNLYDAPLRDGFGAVQPIRFFSHQ